MANKDAAKPSSTRKVTGAHRDGGFGRHGKHQHMLESKKKKKVATLLNDAYIMKLISQWN